MELNDNISLGIVDYSRQVTLNEQLRYLYQGSKQFIVGCGGVGFWVGLFLAMNGARKFILMDGQNIENSNLNRLPVPLRYVGLNKAKALRRIIKILRPDCNVMILPSHVSDTTIELYRNVLNQGHTNVWDCTDDAKIQTVLYKELIRINEHRGDLLYRKIGYEGFTTGAYQNFDIWFTDEANYRPGYRSSSANAMSSAAAAVVGIFAHGLGVTGDVKVNFKDLIENGGNTDASEDTDAYAYDDDENEDEGEF